MMQISLQAAASAIRYPTTLLLDIPKLEQSETAQNRLDRFALYSDGRGIACGSKRSDLDTDDIGSD